MSYGNGAARRKVLLAGVIGNFVEWYDFLLYGVFATTIASVFFPKSSPAAALLSTFAIFGVAFVIRPLGGVVFGHLSDRFGRRFALVLSISLMSASTVALGLLPGYAQIGVAAPVLLLLCRLVQGFSAAGEYTGTAIFVVEHAPYSERGRDTSIPAAVVYITAAVGALVAVTMTSTTTPDQLISWGWRIPFLAAAPLALIGLYLRMRVAESPEFAALRAEGHLESAPLKEALRVAKRPMLILIGYTMVYGVASYVTTFLLSYLTVTVKFSKSESLVVYLVLELVAAASCVLTGYVIDRVGRKPIAVAAVLGLGAWAIPTFMFLRHSSLLEASLIAAVFGFFSGCVASTTALAIVELFPARVRASASGLSYNICLVVFGGTMPYLGTWLVEGGHFLAPGYYLASLCVIAAVVAAVGIGNHAESNNRNDVVLPATPVESS